MNRRSILVFALPALALSLMLGAWTTDARHNRLTRSAPLADSTVTAPTEIRLWFSERPMARLSSIVLQAADSTRIPMGEVRATDEPLSVAATIEQPLRAGQYSVTWRTSSADGHVVRGRYVFTVRE